MPVEVQLDVGLKRPLTKSPASLTQLVERPADISSVSFPTAVMATFERIHSKLVEFCDSEPDQNPVSETILTLYIEQLLQKDENTTMPQEFLDNLEMKINVLGTLKSKIDKNSQLSEGVDKLWVRWLKRLFSKEEADERRAMGKTIITPINPKLEQESSDFSMLVPIRSL